MKGVGEFDAVKSNGVVVDGYEQPKLLNCELNCGMNLDPTSSLAEARLPPGVGPGELRRKPWKRLQAVPKHGLRGRPGRWLCK